jgi:hypothetical protein
MKMTLRAGIPWMVCITLMSACGGKDDPPPQAALNDDIISLQQILEVRGTECYKQALEVEAIHDEKGFAEFLDTVAAGKIAMGKRIVADWVPTAEFDVEICRRYAQCYEITDEERLSYVASCLHKREYDRAKMSDL